jgi:hypothetical protein
MRGGSGSRPARCAPALLRKRRTPRLRPDRKRTGAPPRAPALCRLHDRRPELRFLTPDRYRATNAPGRPPRSRAQAPAASATYASPSSRSGSPRSRIPGPRHRRHPAQRPVCDLLRHPTAAEARILGCQKDHVRHRRHDLRDKVARVPRASRDAAYQNPSPPPRPGHAGGLPTPLSSWRKPSARSAPGVAEPCRRRGEAAPSPVAGAAGETPPIPA